MALPQREGGQAPAARVSRATGTSGEGRASPLPLSASVRRVVALQLRVLGHPLRVQAIEQLARGGRTVEELAKALGITPNAMSKHLRELYRAGLLWRRQEGNRARYGLHDTAAARAIVVLARSAEERRRPRQPASDGGPPPPPGPTGR